MATLRAFPNSEPIGGAIAEKVDMKFEVVVIPVADVDRSKAFYTKLGWRLDADFRFDNGFRIVQFTPRLRVLGSIWYENDNRRARFGPGALPDRLRSGGSAERSCCARY